MIRLTNSNLLQMRFFVQTLKPAAPLWILEFIVIDVPKQYKDFVSQAY